MNTNPLLVTMALLLLLPLLQVPTLSSQGYGHFAGCYDDMCNQFTRCMSKAANKFWTARAKCDEKMRDNLKVCDPGSGGEFCRFGCRLARAC